MTEREPALSVRDLSKTFTGQRALDKVCMEVLPGEVHALVGQNGSGKSTLIKCLSGYQSPDPGGQISVAGVRVQTPLSAADAAHHGMAFVHQDLGIVQSLTVLENFCLGRGFSTGPIGNIRWRVEAQRVRRLLADFGHDIDPRVEMRRLSSSDRTIVAIVRALAALEHQPHLLVLDEPTAALPKVEVDFLFAAVRNAASRGIGIIYVSHRLEEVFLLADRVTVLRDGVRVGTFRVADLTENDLVELITGRKIGEYSPPTTWAAEKDPLIEVENLSGARLKGVSFSARRGEVVGVAGLLGSGCSELARLIFGADVRQDGTIRFKGNQVNYRIPSQAIKDGIGMISEDRRLDGYFSRLSVRENISITDLRRFWKRGRLDRGAERREIAALMREFQVHPPDPDRRMADFSGGNQQKALVAKWVRLKPDLLICDEPVVGVDIGSKVDIYRILERIAAEGATVLLMSTEFKDLAALCDRVIVLNKGRIVGELVGAHLTKECIARLAYAS
ncbi:MAG: hypothetical protein A2W26_01160 [Acidobacteria bacterium RBG_16_64_8]|nr:MAG: hypothetical protein A2W26_01160 [Acidobacteria bacterium RBG_16_64_8]